MCDFLEMLKESYSFSPLAGIRLAERYVERTYGDASLCFSPLAGIRLAERNEFVLKGAKGGGFSPLAGIRLAERKVSAPLDQVEIIRFSPLAGIRLAERDDRILKISYYSSKFQSPCGD